MHPATLRRMPVEIIAQVLIDPVFGPGRSVSRAVGKQIQICSLILVPHAFTAVRRTARAAAMV
jgi:hypothetical protein